jgi:hypothetical protein
MFDVWRAEVVRQVTKAFAAASDPIYRSRRNPLRKRHRGEEDRCSRVGVPVTGPGADSLPGMGA